MATIDELVEARVLELFQVPDDIPDRLPVRPLWMTQDLISYIDGTLVYDPRMIAGRSAYEHLEQFFVDFRCDDPIHASDLRRMMPTRRGVWSMHPPLLRIYGWMPRRHAMVAVRVEFESDTKTDASLNDKCRDLVADFVQRHGITEIFQGDFLSAFPKTP